MASTTSSSPEGSTAGGKGYAIAYCTCPTTPEVLEKLSATLLERKQVACISSWPVTSQFVWQGKVEKESEHLMMITTRYPHHLLRADLLLTAHAHAHERTWRSADNVAALTRVIKENHPRRGKKTRLLQNLFLLGGSNHWRARASVVVVLDERSPPLRSRGDVAWPSSCASVWLSEASNLNQSCWRTWLADGRSRGSCASRDRNSRCAASLKHACSSSPTKASALQFTCRPSSPSLRTHTAHGTRVAAKLYPCPRHPAGWGGGGENAPCVGQSASRRCGGQGRTRAPGIVAAAASAAVDLVVSSC
jgi:uncharacterized protein involved in tolerance to divalent cations